GPMTTAPVPFAHWETLLRHDPGQRGVSGYRHLGLWLAPYQLQTAAESLAQNSGSVLIVTGFAVPVGEQIFGETDGPPGALLLAKLLADLGRDVWLLSDAYSLPLLQCGADMYRFPRDHLLSFPFESQV